MTDRFSDMVIKETELTEQIEREQIRYFDIENEIISKIRALHNANYNRVLFGVFVQMKSLQQVANDAKRSRSWTKKQFDDGVQEFETVHKAFLNGWVIDQMDNSEQIKILMNQMLEVQHRKQQILDEEAKLKAVLLEEMQENQIDTLENVNIKISYVAKSTRKTVDGKKLKELFPDAFRKCIHSSEVSPYIRVQVMA